MEQTTSLDFPIPNEIIAIVLDYLSQEELFSLAEVGTERLRKSIYSVLRRKSRGKFQLM